MKKRFAKPLISFLSIFLFSVSGTAQITAGNCALTEAPRVLGLRLGMTPAEAQGALGKNPKVKVKTSGDRTFFQNYIGKKRPPASLTGVRALYLRFLDGRLYQIEVFYRELAGAPTLESFAANLAARLSFSPEAWRFENNKALIECGAFTLAADKPVDARVELTDTARLAEAEARREKSEK